MLLDSGGVAPYHHGLDAALSPLGWPMRFRRLNVLLVTVPVVVLAASGAAAGPAGSSIPIANSGFERGDQKLRPARWQTAEAPPPSSAIAIDTAVRHGGGSSLRMSNPQPASVTLESEPVALAVGRLYRLSGWIRTEQAFADPMSRYPTAVAACLTMASFPFTNHSPTVGADTPWTEVSTLFIATKGEDRVRVHLGYNGAATGDAWFDDLSLAEVGDISAYVAPETVRWFGPAYRYDDRGWSFVHIEGEPYQRGYQYGALLADEIAAYITKLGYNENNADSPAGWRTLRGMADAMLLRSFDEEYLTEMKGIADGAAHAGAKLDGKGVDLLDIVTVNSVIDLGQLRGATSVTPSALSGRSFLKAEDELLVPEAQHKCSSFAATGPATADGRVVFGQIFMWNGYTGIHWTVLCDVVPASGHRLVYETFPGGIHSGADFYINSAGIVIGETTTGQTPFDPTGTPQSNRIRKAAQYASSIDDVVRILREKNNGLYTNDWPIADVKTDEVAIYLLGTHQAKLWRAADDPFGTPGFLWSNNNNRDAGVRSEYAVQPGDAPYDMIFSPWDRDLAFWQFYQRAKGKIDSIAAVNLLASSPINRPHACDGKITTSEMAEQLVFLAHYGKVTLREKFPDKGSRRMPDLPGAIPHLSLGYSTPSPIFIGDKLAAMKASGAFSPPAPPVAVKNDLGAVSERYKVEGRRLWRGTLRPAADADGWLVSGSVAYWRMLDGAPDDVDKSAAYFRDQLAELTDRYLYTVAHEVDVVPTAARQVYDRFGEYRIPRVKGTFVLHQLRLLLGNETFLKVMSEAHARFAAQPISTAAFIAVAEEVSGRELGTFIRQWTDRMGLPDPRPSIATRRQDGGWVVAVEVTQGGQPYQLETSVAVEAGGKRLVRPMAVAGATSRIEITVADQPTRVSFNPGNDFPVAHERYYTWANFVDDWPAAVIAYGTSREIEANHTLALRWQTTLADAFTEALPPVWRDSELSAEQLASHDVIVMGQPADNSLTARLAAKLPVELGKDFFRWQGVTYAASDDGLFLVLPNPYNPKRVLYLITANSALELYQMTRSYTRDLPSWAVFKGDHVADRGYHAVERFTLAVSGR